jgi:DcmR-like sensory protein
MQDPARTSGAPHPPHVVQLYGGNDDRLIADVARFLQAGAEARDGLLVVARPAHVTKLRIALRELGLDTRAAERARTLRFLDARRTLGMFMLDGYPDWDCFDASVGATIRELHARCGAVRAYGEMVGVLWQLDQFPSAIRLEQLWNRLRREVACHLYCAYPIDIFDERFELGLVGGLLGVHDHLVGALDAGALERALDAAAGDVLRHEPVLRERAVAGQHSRITARLPRAEAAILWLRTHLPEHAGEIVRRARASYVAERA